MYFRGQKKWNSGKKTTEITCLKKQHLNGQFFNIREKTIYSRIHGQMLQIITVNGVIGFDTKSLLGLCLVQDDCGLCWFQNVCCKAVKSRTYSNIECLKRDQRKAINSIWSNSECFCGRTTVLHSKCLLYYRAASYTPADLVPVYWQQLQWAYYL